MARSYRALPPLANRYSGVLEAAAECDECEWLTESRKNALALGSQHARRTGHQVTCTQTISVRYNRKEGVDSQYRVT
jgi:hypothetical protein